MTTATNIQGIGMHKAKAAGEVCVGDRLVWNYGYTSLVTRIVSETPAFVTIEHDSEEGKLYQRRLKKSRAVAFTTKF